MLTVLSAACQDSVLAVRIQAAASLAALCGMLASVVAADPAVGARLLPGCLRLADAAAADSDKLRPSGLHALGSLFALAGRLPAGLVEEQQQLFAVAAATLQDCLGAANARVQWAACNAAGDLLACPAPPVQRHASGVLQSLVALLRQCPNFRSRALAAAALQRLGSLEAAVEGTSPVAQLDALADLLFSGEPACLAEGGKLAMIRSGGKLLVVAALVQVQGRGGVAPNAPTADTCTRRLSTLLLQCRQGEWL